MNTKPIHTNRVIPYSSRRYDIIKDIIRENWASPIKIHQIYVNDINHGEYLVKFFYEDLDSGYKDWESLTIIENQ